MARNLILDVHYVKILRQRGADQFLQHLEGDATQDGFDMADAGLGIDLAAVLCPTAERGTGDRYLSQASFSVSYIEMPLFQQKKGQAV